MWWKSCPLKLRLTIWCTVVASGALLGMAVAAYALISYRLHLEFDQKLHNDWERVEAHLELDPAGRIQWHTKDARWAGGIGQAAAWFEVWSEGKELLLCHRPVPAELIAFPLPGPVKGFRTFTLDNRMPVRAMEQPASIAGRSVILRVFRDESRLHLTLREILVAFALGVPLAAILASLGGYVMAERTLAPLGAMARQARQITSESLSQRLPNPNPHDELGELATVFNQTLQRLEDSFKSLRHFTADASHELRTPLTALRTVGEVSLREGVDAAGLRETVGSMLEEAQRLNDLIDSLLLLSRIESNRSPQTLARVCLQAVLADVRERIGVLAAEKEQTIELQCDPDVFATADCLLLRHAVMNIVHNAIRYSPLGTKVLIRCFQGDDQAIVEIADEGPGIAPEHHHRIFERFFRIDKARSRADGGAGLGLAIAKLSIEQNGGSIELESTVGTGSRFRIILPGTATGRLGCIDN